VKNDSIYGVLLLEDREYYSRRAIVLGWVLRLDLPSVLMDLALVLGDFNEQSLVTVSLLYLKVLEAPGFR
jgi:hypothetical protein